MLRKLEKTTGAPALGGPISGHRSEGGLVNDQKKSPYRGGPCREHQDNRSMCGKCRVDCERKEWMESNGEGPTMDYFCHTVPHLCRVLEPSVHYCSQGLKCPSYEGSLQYH